KAHPGTKRATKIRPVVGKQQDKPRADEQCAQNTAQGQNKRSRTSQLNRAIVVTNPIRALFRDHTRVHEARQLPDKPLYVLSIHRSFSLVSYAVTYLDRPYPGPAPS